ncbi:MAG: ABC transporter permease [Clostridiales Family XIII bacterium]|jgi:ABC-2 type transport system permease protein|nr:ABC transporter permease [Clostridiales Family XIII bacterium]
MNNIATVIKFEYSGHVKAKSFKVMSAIFAVLIIGLSFVPRAMSAMNESVKEDTTNKTAVYILEESAKNDPVISGAFTKDTLSQVVAKTDWINGGEKGYDENDLKRLIGNGEADMAIIYGGGPAFKFFAPGNKLSAYSSVYPIGEFITALAKQQAIAGLPEDVRQDASEIASMASQPEIIDIGGNAQNNFWIGYFLMFLLFYMIMGYGNFVSSSIVSEKTSKAMELLITAAKPFDLMIGKVVGVGLAALTQMAIILASAVAGILLNLPFWKEKYSSLFDLITTTNVSPALAVVLIVFFFLGFFLYAFIFAALSSTVSKAEEAATVVTLPMLLLFASLALGFLSLSGVLNKTLVVVLSYIPFFTPFVMVSRFCLGDVSLPGLASGFAVLFAGVMGIAWVAAKIYRVGVMMYGKPMKLPELIKTVRQR